MNEEELTAEPRVFGWVSGLPTRLQDHPDKPEVFEEEESPTAREARLEREAIHERMAAIAAAEAALAAGEISIEE
jgi:hypothetical protein